VGIASSDWPPATTG
jgi:hypothetical protein